MLHILDTLCKCVSIHLFIRGFEFASKRNQRVNAVHVLLDQKIQKYPLPHHQTTEQTPELIRNNPTKVSLSCAA